MALRTAILMLHAVVVQDGSSLESLDGFMLQYWAKPSRRLGTMLGRSKARPATHSGRSRGNNLTHLRLSSVPRLLGLTESLMGSSALLEGSGSTSSSVCKKDLTDGNQVSPSFAARRTIFIPKNTQTDATGRLVRLPFLRLPKFSPRPSLFLEAYTCCPQFGNLYMLQPRVVPLFFGSYCENLTMTYESSGGLECFCEKEFSHSMYRVILVRRRILPGRLCMN